MSLNPHYICTPDILKEKDGKPQVSIKARTFRSEKTRSQSLPAQDNA
tara:strand:+ start:446 stop:586 length:141 start_codon:yes stop_codon:yes gene_type:complete